MNQGKYKIFVLLLVWFYPFSYMYNYDWPQSLSTPLQDQPYNYTLKKINLIYTFTAIGVIIFQLKLGMVYDSVALRKSLIIVPSIGALSQLLIFLMFYLKVSWNYYIIVICRFLFGIMGQSIFMLQAIYLIKMFQKQSEKFIGVGSALGSLGSPVNSLLTPIFFTLSKNVYLPLLMGGLFDVVTMFMGVILAYIITKSETQQANQRLLNKQQLQQVPALPQNILQQIRSFPTELWILELVVFFRISTTVVFGSISIDLFAKRFSMSYQISGLLLLIPISVAVLSCLFWYNVKGNVRNIFVIAGFMNLTGYISLYFLPNSEVPQTYHYVISILVLITIGIVFGSHLMKIIPVLYKINKPENTGAAFSINSIVFNLAYLTVPFLSSLLVQSANDEADGYKNLGLLFIGLVVVQLLLSNWIRSSNRFLNFEDKSELRLKQSLIEESINKQ